MWVSIPILIRLADRGIRWYRRNRRPARILGAEFMGNDIIALRISRPKGFHFRYRTPQTGTLVVDSLWSAPQALFRQHG